MAKGPTGATDNAESEAVHGPGSAGEGGPLLAEADLHAALARVPGEFERIRRALQAARQGAREGVPQGRDLRRLVEEEVVAAVRFGVERVAPAAGESEEPARLLVAALFSDEALERIAGCVESALGEREIPREFDFSGRADFISLEEVFQLLASGCHTGQLTLEKPDNRVEVHVREGKLAFVDPRRMIRRALGGQGFSSFREIPREALEAAEQRREQNGMPVFLSLLEQGHFKRNTFIQEVRLLSCELIYHFLCEPASCSFAYRALEGLEPYVEGFNLEIPVMPLLLEGHRRMDDWRALRQLFPGPDAVVRPVADMFGRISSMNLDVAQIRLLAMLDGKTTVQEMAERSGFPLFDVCQVLDGLARSGVVVPPGGEEWGEAEAGLSEEDLRALEEMAENARRAGIPAALDQILRDPLATEEG